MVRLLGQVAGAAGEITEKRAMLMTGLCEIVAADAWIWMMVGRMEEGKLPTFSIVQSGGFSEQQYADFLSAQEHQDMGRLTAPFLAEYAEKETHLTRLRQQIDSSTNAFKEADVYALWQKADVGPLMLSARPTANGETSGIGIYRRFDRELFSARESRIAHILLSEVPWLHDELAGTGDSAQLQNLSPRLNTVLNLLLQGRGRKQMALEIGISVHTLNGYVKDLYQRFGVHSQAELIRRFVDGDGGDVR